ncbi:hypothetical protein NPIL_87561 [Nephila pilipes]|uniref:Uncharacterized protein n=1 Tax=Nephila pilipes TaxID=299642 RepID=A0A8X6KHU4_NEPPI|nr:hypothetical protein NPIL_87561 [Nephila pilipes]
MLKSIDIRGFSDASERYFRAVVYCRPWSSTGENMVRLVIRKSRVSPLRNIIQSQGWCYSLTFKVSEKSQLKLNLKQQYSNGVIP